MLLALSRLFLAICLLKKGPQDVPKSNFLSSIVLFLYALVAFLMLYDQEHQISVVLIEIGFEIILVMGFIALLLLVSGKLARYQQAMTALLGTDALISFFALPPMYLQVSGRGAELLILTILGLTLWHWVVCGHIIRHALGQTFPFGLGVAFLYIIVTYQLMNWFAEIVAAF